MTLPGWEALANLARIGQLKAEPPAGYRRLAQKARVACSFQGWTAQRAKLSGCFQQKGRRSPLSPLAQIDGSLYSWTIVSLQDNWIKVEQDIQC